MNNNSLNEKETPTYRHTLPFIFFLLGFFLLLIVNLPQSLPNISSSIQFILFLIPVQISAILFLLYSWRTEFVLSPYKTAIFSSFVFIFLFSLLSTLFSKSYYVSIISVERLEHTLLFLGGMCLAFLLSVQMFSKERLVYLYEIVIFSAYMIPLVAIFTSVFTSTTFHSDVDIFLKNSLSLGLFLVLATIVSLALLKTTNNRKIRLAIYISAMIFILFASFFFITANKNSTISPVIPELYIVQETLKESLLRTLIGSGPNTFPLQEGIYKSSEKYATPPHWIVSFLTEFGMLSLAAWIIFFFLFFYSGIKKISQYFYQKTKIKNLHKIFLFLICLYLWVSVLFFSSQILFIILAIIFTGAYIRVFVDKEEEASTILPTKNQKMFLFIFILILILSVIGTPFFGKKIYSFYFFKKAELSDSVEEKVFFVEKAILVSGEDTYYRFLAELYTKEITRLYRLPTSRDRNANIVKIGDIAIKNARKAIENNDKNYNNWWSLGKIYLVFQKAGVSGGYNEGKRVYLEARGLSPNNISLLLEIIEFAFLAEDKELVAELLKDILWRHPDNREVEKKLQIYSNINIPYQQISTVV